MSTAAALSHIPAPRQLPFLGNTLDCIHDSDGLQARCARDFGDLYRISLLGRWRVTFASADAIGYILTDPDRIFSAAGGWEMIAPLFGGGLMLRDGADHRAHRRIMQAAFRKPALDSYLAMMAPALDEMLENWPTGKRFRFFPAVKDLTLRMGAHVFMGLATDDPQAEVLNRAFRAELAGALTPIRRPLPFTAFRRGLAGRDRLTDTFRSLIAQRRAAGGEDFFSRMCRAQDDDGQGWSDDDIVTHFNFLMMAAHDTTASGLTTMAWALAEHPDWQDRLAAEVDALGDGPMTPGMLTAMPLTEQVFREALRLIPPVPFIPRRAMRAFDWQGTHIPAGTDLTLATGWVMRSPDHFTDPDRFDPDRFSPDRAEHLSHRFAWTPFGGGVHKCIGLHFSMMQVKAFTRALLSRHRISAARPGPTTWRMMPIPRPRGDLPLRLTPRHR